MTLPAKTTHTSTLTFDKGEGFYVASYYLSGGQVQFGGLKYIKHSVHKRTSGIFRTLAIDQRMLSPTMRFLQSAASRLAVINTRKRSELMLQQLMTAFEDRPFWAEDALAAVDNTFKPLIRHTKNMGVILKYEMLTRPGLLEVRPAGGNRQRWCFVGTTVPANIPLHEVGTEPTETEDAAEATPVY